MTWNLNNYFEKLFCDSNDSFVSFILVIGFEENKIL